VLVAQDHVEVAVDLEEEEVEVEVAAEDFPTTATAADVLDTWHATVPAAEGAHLVAMVVAEEEEEEGEVMEVVVHLHTAEEAIVIIADHDQAAVTTIVAVTAVPLKLDSKPSLIKKNNKTIQYL